MGGVFNLGVGQGGAFDRAPHHRLGAAIELAAHQKLMELADDGGFRAVVHGGVAPFPVAQNSQALKVCLLHIHPLGGIFAAALAEFRRRNLVLWSALASELFLDLPFDRQAMTVPAWAVVDILAEQELTADYEVLQQLVQGVADVDGTIGVGRAVVQHEQRRAARLPVGTQGPVEILLRPRRQDFWLLLRQASAHRKARVGQEYGVAIVACAGLFVGRGVVGHKLWDSLRVGKGELGQSRRALDHSGGVTPGA